MYGLIGFITGFICGMLINLYLLKDVPREKLRDKNVRLKYGGLNWGIALLGLAIGIALDQNR